MSQSNIHPFETTFIILEIEGMLWEKRKLFEIPKEKKDEAPHRTVNLIEHQP